jgi:diguanylate cyclase (GGDEF)-like protein
MLKVVSCLAYEHDYSFVVVAAIVCVASAVMTIRLFDRAGRLSGEARLSWILLSAMACGAAIWTTHFVAMLGFRLPMDHAFDPALTIASLLIAFAFSAAGLFLATSRTKGVQGECGGVVIGLGIVAMHFTGMAGLEVAGRIEWDWTLVGVSVLFALCFGTATTHILARHSFRFSRPLAMGLLVLAICTMHFTAMGAATLVPDPSVLIETKTISSEFLAVLVLAAMAIITGLALYTIDARSQRELLDGFRHAALHDALTGLPNRAFLSANLPGVLEKDRASGMQTAVLVIDLDRFKEINDVHGHHTGDFLLQDLARRLTQLLLKGEMIARVGGDEFIAVKRQVRTKAELEEFARRLTDCVQVPLHHNASTLTVGVSIGVSLSPGDSVDTEELIGAADLAMYRAKRSLGDKICYYQPSMDEGRRARSALAMALRHAIERDELELHYQPQFDVQSGLVKGYEALLRWNHPAHGTISPIEFIPIAEETGLIIPIGEWVLKTACAEVAGWTKPYRIAVNIASAQLTQADLPKIVHETLLMTGLPASRLELEITEASIIDDRERALHVIRQLKALGVSIAMDDYGTGYSSLSTLQMFPFDKVKIDRSFIEGLTSDAASTAIVKATILLASSLKMAVLAEGVERKEQADFLQAEGCMEVQGFLFGRPQPLDKIAGHVGRGTRNNSKPRSSVSEAA